jgi:hypothetical protein
MPDYAPRLDIHEVKYLHYAMIVRLGKLLNSGLYRVIENALSIGVLYLLGDESMHQTSFISNPVKRKFLPLSPDWFTGWEKLGIDMQTIIRQKYYWQDFEVLQYFHNMDCAASG